MRISATRAASSGTRPAFSKAVRVSVRSSSTGTETGALPAVVFASLMQPASFFLRDRKRITASESWFRYLSPPVFRRRVRQPEPEIFGEGPGDVDVVDGAAFPLRTVDLMQDDAGLGDGALRDRTSTRLNSSH